MQRCADASAHDCEQRAVNGGLSTPLGPVVTATLHVDQAAISASYSSACGVARPFRTTSHQGWAGSMGLADGRPRCAGGGNDGGSLPSSCTQRSDSTSRALCSWR